MAGTLYLATLGFHENFALRRLSSSGAGPGDYVAAITVKPPAKAVLAAWNSLRAIATRLGVAPIELLQLDPSDPEALTADIIEWASKAAAERGVEAIVIDATGGSRLLTVATLLAAIALQRRYNVRYYIQSDTGDDWEAKIDAALIEAITSPPTPEKRAILQAVLQNPGATPAQIAEAIGMHPKTLANHLTKLKKQRLVAQKGRARGL
ncbi:MAG: CRISPR-associated CARF protein Csa3, partial [Desulfurococcales archaeon]|nr:CRISPR-associated CARF protein Csa3 [Desulfurococcales archaeon]